MTMAEILEHALALPKSQWTTQTERSAAKALRALGWDNSKPDKVKGKSVRVWRPKPAEVPTGRDAEREVTPNHI
jgi:hypothetical protein